MRQFSFASFLDVRILTFLAVVYAIVAGVEIWKTTESATYNREIHPELPTDALEGTRKVEYAFSAEHRKLKGLWVFFVLPSNAASKGRLDLTLRREGTDAPFWSQSFECNQAQFVGHAQLCRVAGLENLEKGGRYILTYAMPEMKPGTGWPLAYGASNAATSSVRWDSHVSMSSAPSMLWLEREPRFPRRNLLFGGALILLCALAAKEHTLFRLPALIVAVPSCILAATYFWQVHLWQFWGNFWPDGYSGLGYQFSEWLTGRITARDCLASFQSNRTGQIFIVSLVVGAFRALGLSLKHGYIAANAVFLTVAAGSLLGLLNLSGIKRDRAVIAMILFFFGNVCVMGAVGEMQSDLGGIAATMFFIYTLARALEETDSRRRCGWYIACGVAGFLACVTRLALLSLPLVPACLFVWSLACERHRSLQERAGYLIPTVLAAALLVACWTGLGLWTSLSLSFSFSKSYSNLFTWNEFFIKILESLQLSLVLVPLLWRRLFTERTFAAVAGSAFGLLALFAAIKQPVWLRYMDPAAAVGVILLIWAFREWPTKDRLFLAVACLSALFNLYILKPS